MTIPCLVTHVPTCSQKLWMRANRSRTMHKIWTDLPEGLPAHKPRLLRCVWDSSSRSFNGPCSLLTRRCRLLLPTSFAWSCSFTHPVMHSCKRALVIITKALWRSVGGAQLQPCWPTTGQQTSKSNSPVLPTGQCQQYCLVLDKSEQQKFQ